MYPKGLFEKGKIWGISTVILGLLCIVSVFICVLIGAKLDKQMAYYFVADSNTFLAVCMGISSFLFFKNINI